MHTVGLGFLVGISAVVNIRLLGFAQSVPVKPLRRFFGFMWFGFWINAISGLLLLIVDAPINSTNTITTVFSRLK